MTATVAVAFAAILDGLVGEFPGSLHPVAWFGRLVGAIDRDWPRPRLAGTVVATLLPLGAALLAGGLVLAGAAVDPWAGAIVAGLVLFSATSLRMLLDEAAAVNRASSGDLTRARSRLTNLAGRDADDLTAGEVRSAAVESLAENLADGLVAPLFGFVVGALIGGLPAAAAAAAWIKAVNTLDSMLGYRARPLGWASARLDDAVMFVPARATAVLLAVAGLSPAVLARARDGVREPASPNSGWPMSTLARLLDVELRKPTRYVINPDAGLPTTADAVRGRQITRRAGVFAMSLAGVAAWF